MKRILIILLAMNGLNCFPDGLALANLNLTAAEANTKNPFAEYGYDKSIMLRSASETVFEEFFDLEDTVELGGVYFNIRTYEIAGFIPDEKLKNEINVDLIALSVDPEASRYWWITPYHYCKNNPVKYIDPDGRDAVIAIKGNQITISANVYLYGEGATNAVMSQYQSDVNAKWGGTYSATSANGTSFNVSINVNFSLYGGKEKNNPTIIPESWNPFNRDNFVEVGVNDNRSYVQGGDEGVWRSQGRNGMTLGQDNPAPHEVGHLLGLGDRYTDKGGVNKGWEGNIMGESRTGKVEQRNIDGILKDAMKAYDKWIQNSKNEGKEFRYEINTNNPNN